MNRLDEKFSLLRRRAQGRIRDVLRAVDRATGSTYERGILCGVVPFLNDEPFDTIEREIHQYVVWLEDRAREHERSRGDSRPTGAP